MRAHRLIALCCCVALLVAAPGCSFISVRGPPAPTTPEAVNETVDCTSSRTSPALDATAAFIAVITSVVAAVAPPNRETDTQNCHLVGTKLQCPTYPYDKSSYTTVAWVSGALAVLLAGSAVYGFVTTSRCREAQRGALVRACGRGDQTSCEAIRPPEPDSAPRPDTYQPPGW